MPSRLNERRSRDVAAVPACLEMARTALETARSDFAAVDIGYVTNGELMNDWSLAPEALRFLIRLVQQLSPRHILEFGSGLSTIALARARARLRDRCFISSVDHDPEFGSATLQRLTEEGLRRHVSLQIAPLVSRMCGEKMLPTYCLQRRRFASRRPPDLVLIDGPPIVMGGREGIFYQALDFARAGTIVLLDDANRGHEQDALTAWHASLGGAMETTMLPGMPRGMAAIIVREPIRKNEILAHRAELIAEDLATVVPADAAVILVDQGSSSSSSGAQATGRETIPFLEKDGQYWGPPPDDATAILELERERQAGALFIAFLEPCYWWLDHYSGFAGYLRSQFTCVLENGRVTVFDLRNVTSAV